MEYNKRKLIKLKRTLTKKSIMLRKQRRDIRAFKDPMNRLNRQAITNSNNIINSRFQQTQLQWFFLEKI
jgi:hypothetical protein